MHQIGARISSLKGRDLADIIVAILKDMNFQLINLVGKGSTVQDFDIIGAIYRY